MSIEAQDEQLRFKDISVQNPGGDQARIILSRERFADFLGRSIREFVVVTLGGQAPPSNRQFIEEALLFNHALMPGKVEDAMREVLTEGQLRRVRRANKQGKVVKFEPAPRRNTPSTLL